MRAKIRGARRCVVGFVVLPAVSTALVLTAASIALMFASTPALARFSRPLIGEIKGTPAGGFHGVEGIAIDPAAAGNIWVAEAGGGIGQEQVDEFNAANAFVGQSSVPNFKYTASLAYDDLSAKLELAPGGNVVTGGFQVGEWVAADDSNSLTAGDVYRTHDSGGASDEGRVTRVTAGGAPAPFDCAAGIADAYIENGELVGTGIAIGTGYERWNGGGIQIPLGGIAVDSSEGATAGDIYIVNRYSHVQSEAGASSGVTEIDRFDSSGCYLGSIAGVGGVPFGHDQLGIAVDPTNGDLLVTDTDRAAVDEFTSAGVYLGGVLGTSPSTPFAQSPFDVGGVAVSGSGDLYVDDVDRQVVDEFGQGAFYPTAVTGEVSEDRSGGVTLNGTLRGVANAEGDDLIVAGCEFEYVTQAAFEAGGFAGASLAPCALDAGASPVGQRLAEKDYAVHAQIAGLTAGETYEYRLVVSAPASERGGSQPGVSESFAAAAAPVVGNVAVSEVSSAFARLGGQIDPLGLEASYAFQYEPAAQYEALLAQGAADPFAGAVSVPVPAGSVAAGDRSVRVSVPAGGLLAGTSYACRLVASNAAGAGESPVVRFLTLPAGLSGLPDGRAYELVTPASKGDAEDLFGQVNHLSGEPENQDVGYASGDGEHFMLFTAAALGSFPAAGGNAYMFSRGSHGWSFSPATSPLLGTQNLGDMLLEPWAFSSLAFEDQLNGENGLQELDLMGPPGGPYAPAAPNPVGSATLFEQLELQALVLVGASADTSHLLEQSRTHARKLCSSAEEKLSEGIAEHYDGLYEWSALRGCLALVDVQSGGGKLVSACGATLGQLGGGFEEPGGTRGAVSADGSKVFFTAPAPFDGSNGILAEKGCWNHATANPPELYMRLDGESTVEISKPAAGVKPEGVYPAVFVGAAADGSRVFFVTHTQLTADAAALKTHGLELYEYDTLAPEGERLRRVSGGELPSGPVEGKVLDVPAVAEDGSAVYFNAEAKLTPQAGNGGLYRYDTQTGQTSFIAPVQPYPTTSRSYRHPTLEKIGATWYSEETRDLVAGLSLEAPYYLTRDGRYLIYDAYRYDAQSESSVCVLCYPGTTTPIPDASINRGAVEGHDLAGGPPAAMSENGQYVFFDTSEALVPKDINGTLDVYEWHDGTLALISSGEDPFASFLLGSSSYVDGDGEAVEGANVFFGTHAKLVPQDTDNEGDLYDARIGGGFATAATTGICEGDACANPPPPALFQTPASLTLAGGGNLAPPPPARSSTAKKAKKPVKCAKGKSLKHGKCVRVVKRKRAKKASGSSKKASYSNKKATDSSRQATGSSVEAANSRHGSGR